MSPRMVIVGDVHGCVDELAALLKKVKFESGQDQLVLVGDLVGKGPASLETVQLAREMRAQGVRGNHDEAVLRWHRTASDARDSLSMGKMHRKVAESLGKHEWAYLSALPVFLRLPHHKAVVIHGGLRPDRSVEEQTERDLLNLRSLKANGESSYRVDDGEPWAKSWKGPEFAVFGHDARRGLQQYPHAWGLDTGCVYGGQLTALLLPSKDLVSVKAKKVYAMV